MFFSIAFFPFGISLAAVSATRCLSAGSPITLGWVFPRLLPVEGKKEKPQQKEEENSYCRQGWPDARDAESHQFLLSDGSTTNSQQFHGKSPGHSLAPCGLIPREHSGTDADCVPGELRVLQHVLHIFQFYLATSSRTQRQCNVTAPSALLCNGPSSFPAD